MENVTLPTIYGSTMGLSVYQSFKMNQDFTFGDKWFGLYSVQLKSAKRSTEKEVRIGGVALEGGF